MKRRQFLFAGGSLGLVGTVLPKYALSATSPCPPPTFAIDGAASVNTTCAMADPNPPPSNPAGPGYASTMAAYEVKRLTGNLAPSNGKSTMQSVTPAEWLNSDPGNVDLAAVLSAWCGGIGDESTGRLFVLGGGHADSANNGIYVYNFSGTAAPVGFSLLSGSQSGVSAVPAIIQGNSTNFVQYSDGRPSSKHTYDGVAFASNKVFMFGGGSWGAGGFTRDSWKFESGTWTRLPDPPFGSDRPWTAYDPATGKVLYFNPGGDAFAFFNTAASTWGSIKRLSANFAVADAILCHDTTRKRVLVMGSSYNKMWTINWGAETIAEGTYTPSSILAGGGVTALYDSVRDRFWILGGKTGSAGYSTIYEMNPTTFAITPHPMSGDTIPTAASNGSFKRAVLLGNSIGFVSVVDGPAVVIRLP